MAQWAIRGLFFLIMAGTGWQVSRLLQVEPLPAVLVAAGLFVVVCAAEVLFFRRAVADLSAVIFGVLAGFLLSSLFYYVGTLMMEPVDVDRFGPTLRISLLALFSYLMVMVIYKTRDRFHFVIPYVEFRRMRRGPKAVLLDSSAILDGRLAELLEIWPLDAPLIVPTFVLDEMRRLADSSDRARRQRARRGLDSLEQLRTNPKITLSVNDADVPGAEDADTKLVRLASTLDARILTCDFNLQKVARLHDVEIISIHALAQALRPPALPGDLLSLELTHEGQSAEQAVGYLEDGTMVVAENGRPHLGHTSSVVVTKVLQTAGGRMIFGRVRG